MVEPHKNSDDVLIINAFFHKKKVLKRFFNISKSKFKQLSPFFFMVFIQIKWSNFVNKLGTLERFMERSYYKL